jgi:hypothetical protein
MEAQHGIFGKTFEIARSGRGAECRKASLSTAVSRVPPQAWFGVSAVFHDLGPSFTVHRGRGRGARCAPRTIPRRRA